MNEGVTNTWEARSRLGGNVGTMETPDTNRASSDGLTWSLAPRTLWHEHFFIALCSLARRRPDIDSGVWCAPPLPVSHPPSSTGGHARGGRPLARSDDDPHRQAAAGILRPEVAGI